jgi:DNA adenine methylase
MQMQLITSPLRYPGSKVGLVNWMANFLQKNSLVDKQFVEPYAGSASLGLGLLANGSIASLMLFERDPLLFSFWHSVFNRTDELIAQIEHQPINLETRQRLHWLKLEDSVIDDIVLMGFAALLFNRTSFSGVLKAGPIGGALQKSMYTVDCRFNKKEIINRIKKLSEYRAKIEIYFGDAKKALRDANTVNNSNRVYYIDPPYYVQGPKLYRYWYRFSDHVELKEILDEAKYMWCLSYDDHPVIRHFYSNYKLFQPELRYSSRVPKKELELLFTNVKNN